jgi:Phasin protein
MKAMAQAERSGPASTDELFQIGAKRFESLMEVHKGLLDTFERVQRDRLARAMEETKLASEFAAKVAGARSIPDIMAIYQDWMTRCAQMFDEDGRKFLDDSQKVANAALSLLSNGQRNGST